VIIYNNDYILKKTFGIVSKSNCSPLDKKLNLCITTFAFVKWKDNQFYTGYTSDLKRLNEHLSAKCNLLNIGTFKIIFWRMHKPTNATRKYLKSEMEKYILKQNASFFFILR
jgi:predicted GIY-YIG superfamily endonuclease